MANISVFVRTRPMLPNQIQSYQEQERRIKVRPDQTQMTVDLSSNREKIFNFNRVFGPQTTQQMLYRDLGLPQLSQKVLDGFHSTIFAYGQTGSGKTYTIQGPQQNPGIVARIFQDLFSLLAKRNNVQRSYKVLLSFVQIYNEGIFDLIDCSGKPLKMRWNKHQQFIVQNLFEAQCRSKQDALKWWKKGQKHKIMGSHKMNAVSSRSHCLLTLKVMSYDLQDPSNVLQSKFQIVDLAGSQRQKVTKSSGTVFKEAIQINKSLFTLRQVIASLYEISQGQNSNKHIPYRDSKLTSLLKQSIGGNTFCSMIACLNPTSTHFQQSLQTLTYASMASFISNVPIKNIDPKIRQNQHLREQNEQYRKQIKKMSQHIQQLTKMLQAGICMKCQNSNEVSESQQIRNSNNSRKQRDTEELNEPSGILKLPKFQKSSEKHITTLDKQEKKKTFQVPKTQKKTLKTTKDILDSITMIKQLINANTSLRQKIQSLKNIHEKQQKEIFDLMKQNQVLRNRWDMMNDAIGVSQKQEIQEAPIVAYEKMLRQQSGNIKKAQQISKYLRMNSQNSQGSKSTSYNYFLKKNNQADKNLRRRNVSLRNAQHRTSNKSDSYGIY